MPLILPLLVNLFSIGLLYDRWLIKYQVAPHSQKTSFSFLLTVFDYSVTLVLTPLAWVYSFGWEFGIVYWACSSTIISWLFIVYHKKHSTHLNKMKTSRKVINKKRKIYKPLTFNVTKTIQSSYKLLIIITIPFIFSVCLCLLPPLLMHDISSNTLIFFIFSFLIVWPISILECYNFLHKPKQMIIFSSISMCMLISVIGTKLA